MKHSREFDCAAFVRLVLTHELEISPDFPQLDWKRTEPDVIRDIAMEFSIEVPEPSDYNGVLMKVQGNRRSMGSHIGLYVTVNKQVYILHSIIRMGSVLTPLIHLPRLQMEIISYHEWITSN